MRDESCSIYYGNGDQTGGDSRKWNGLVKMQIMKEGGEEND